MKRLSRLRGYFIIAAVATAVSFAAAPAIADVACNSNGDCWHVSQRYTTYPSALGVTFYNDDWHAKHMHDTHYHWYDRNDDQGYYMHGEWHPFDRHHD